MGFCLVGDITGGRKGDMLFILIEKNMQRCLFMCYISKQCSGNVPSNGDIYRWAGESLYTRTDGSFKTGGRMSLHPLANEETGKTESSTMILQNLLNKKVIVKSTPSMVSKYF